MEGGQKSRVKLWKRAVRRKVRSQQEVNALSGKVRSPDADKGIDLK
jgi:hypothetical protein